MVRATDSNNRFLYFLTWSAIALLIFIIHVASDEIAFADAFSYLTYVDNLYFFRADDWFVFEPFSKILLIILRDATGDTEKSVAGAHYVISIVYLLGTLVVFRPSEGNWRGLIMAFALYGPQLAFVTIRATPAYMIASIAVMQAVRGQNRAFIFAGLAIMFHISAVLALLPIIALFFKAKLRWLDALQRPKVLFGSLLTIAIVFLLVGPYIFNATMTIFKNIPFLGKYLVFTVGLSDDGGVNTIVEKFPIGHFVLLAGITIFFIAFMLLKDHFTRKAAIFIVFSYLLYVFTFLAFSPIAAFRQTPFWVLPAFSIFPWHKVGWRGIGQLLFGAVALGMFLFQYSRVI